MHLSQLSLTLYKIKEIAFLVGDAIAFLAGVVALTWLAVRHAIKFIKGQG